VSLRLKLLLPPLILFLLVATLVHVFWMPSSRSQVEQDIFSNQKRTLQALSAAALSPLMKSDLAELTALLDGQHKLNSEWQQISLYNTEGVTLYPLDGARERNPQWFSLQQAIQFQDRTIGNLEVFIDVESLVEQQTKTASLFSSSILGIILLMVFIVPWWQEVVLHRPLRQLGFATAKMSEGDFSVPLTYAGKDLVGQLVVGFKTMRESVEFYQKTLKIDADHQAQAKVIMDNVLDAIITIDAQGLITSVNPATEHIFGYQANELVGQNVSLLVSGSDGRQHDSYLRRYLETGQGEIIGKGREVQAQHKDGTVFSVDLAINTIEVDGQTMFTGIMRDISERKQAEAELLKQRLQIETINGAQSQFIAGGDPRDFFEQMLPDILMLTESEFGLFGEAMLDSNGAQYLKAYALTDISWDDASREFYEKNIPQGLEFRNLDTLFGHVILSGEIVISNEPENDPRNTGIPDRHPRVKTFLGVPIHQGGQLLGMIGLANRPGGYDESIIKRLEPILGTCAQLFNAIGKDRDRQRTALELKRTNSFMAALVENLQAGLLVENELGEVYALNQVYCDMFEKDELPLMIEGEACEQEFDSIKTLFADADGFLQHRQDCLAGERTVAGKEFVLNDGRVLEQNYVPVIVEDEHGEIYRSHVWTYNDISAHKRIQESLALAKEEAEAAANVKSQFLATMSHEIRTPMNGVLGMLHMLGKTELGATQQRLVDTATGSGKVLLSVINDILDFSKLEADKLELESIAFDLENLLGQSIALLAKGAQEKEVELLYSLDSGLPDKVKGDPTRLRQVLTNLISNAIKFTDKGEVVLYAKLVAGNRIRFGVRDTGIGMSKAQQKSLFKAFSQVDSSHTRKYGGTGLGLAISQKLISVMGGEITVVSSPNQGSDFSFELPLDVIENNVSKPYFSDKLAKQRILVVDDNASMRHLLGENLKRWQVSHIGMAVDGDDALAQLRSAVAADEAYDIAILDKKMPGMDGLELARIIRGDATLSSMKLIMLSGIEHNVSAPELDAWLSKPMRRAELFNSLLELLGEQDEDQRENNANATSMKRWFGDSKLLLVEDNEINQQVAEAVLADVGFSLDIVDNGLEALRAVQATDYDAVLMDIQMPVMDGLEATRQIRALGGVYSELPIIAMTAHALSGDADKSMAAGMNGHVTKPIDPAMLYQILARWVTSEVAPYKADKPDITETKEVLPVLPGIDLVDGLQRMCGSWTAYKMILLGFRDAHADTAETLEQYIRQGEWEEAKRLAHTIKGSGGNISAKDLYEIAASVEQCCHQEDADAAIAKLETLKARFNEVITGLADLESIDIEDED